MVGDAALPAGAAPASAAEARAATTAGCAGATGPAWQPTTAHSAASHNKLRVVFKVEASAGTTLVFRHPDHGKDGSAQSQDVHGAALKQYFYVAYRAADALVDHYRPVGRDQPMVDAHQAR